MQNSEIIKNYNNNLKKNNINQKWSEVSFNEKNKLANVFLDKADNLLTKKNIIGIKYLFFATEIMPNNFQIYLRAAKLLLNSKKKGTKLLKLSLKYFETVKNLTNDLDKDFYFSWAKALSLVGKNTQDNTYFLQAIDKLNKAKELLKDESEIKKVTLQKIKLYLSIAKISEEPCDLLKVINLYKYIEKHYKENSPDFFADIGDSIYQMAHYVNNNNLFFEAIYYYKKGLKKEKKFYRSLFSIANTYTQLFINSPSKDYFINAKKSYQALLINYPKDAYSMVEFAHLLGEYGKLNKEIKFLEKACELCQNAFNEDKKNPIIIAQWVESLSFYGAYTNEISFIIDAEKIIAKAVKRYPSTPEIWYAYGSLLNAKSIYFNDTFFDALAVKKYTLGLNKDPLCPEINHQIGLSYYKLGKEDEDIKVLIKATKYFVKALKYKNFSPYTYYHLSKALFKIAEIKENNNLLKSCVHYIEKAIYLADGTNFFNPDFLFFYGKILLASAENTENCNDLSPTYIKILEIFKKVLVLKPNYPNLLYYIGKTYSNQGDYSNNTKYYKKALYFFERGANANNEDDKIYLEWGITLISTAIEENEFSEEKNKFYQKAEVKLIKAAKLGNQYAYYYLACLYSILNKLESSFFFILKTYKENILPSTKDLLEDEWLENLTKTKIFKDFLIIINENKNMIDGH